MVAKHVHHADLRHGHSEEVGTLVHNRADEQTAIGTTVQSQVFRRGVFIINKVFGASDAIVKNILFLQLGAGNVPILAVLVAATQVHLGINAAILDEGQARSAEARIERHVEAAVTVQEGRVVAVFLQAFLIGQEHRDFGTILRGDKDLLRNVVVRLEVDGGRAEHGGGVVVDVVLVNRGREDERGESIEHFGFFIFAAAPGHFAERLNVRRIDLRAGAEYALPFAKWISFGELLTYRTGLWPYAESRTSLTLSPCGWFDLSGNASFTTMGSSMGFLLNLHPGGVNFFVAVDRLKAEFNPQFIPLHDFGLNFSLGLNFAFGKKRAKLDD